MWFCGGLDFGPYTDARVERIRWHPLYDFLEAGLGLRVLGFDLEAAEIMGSSQTRFLSSTLLPFLFRGLPIQTKPD